MFESEHAKGYYYIDRVLMNKEEMVKYFAKHIKSGKVFRVGGDVLVMANLLMDTGLVNRKGKINKYMLGRFYSQREGVKHGKDIDISTTRF